MKEELNQILNDRPDLIETALWLVIEQVLNLELPVESCQTNRSL